MLSQTNRTDPSNGLFESDTGQLLLSAPSRQLRVITPRLEGACLDPATAPGRVTLGQLTIESTSVPASVTADPASGTIPTGYLILNVGQGTLKRHAGSFDWQTVVGTAGGKIGFYGVTPVIQPAGAGQAAVTLGNADGEIGGLAISDPPTQAEVQALRDKCEELADDVRNLSGLIHALRAALVAVGLVKGGA